MDDLATVLALLLAHAEDAESLAEVESDALSKSFLWGSVTGLRRAVSEVVRATGVAPVEPTLTDD